MYVVSGVSGHTGSVVASTLLAASTPVRVIVRDRAKGAAWAARGAEVAIASLDDRAALAGALRDAKGAYLLMPPGASDPSLSFVEDRRRTAEAIVGAVTDAAPAHVVMLSSIGANLASGTGPIQFLHPVEEGLRASGVPTTLLRCGFFMENWGAMLKGAIASGALHYGIRGDLKFPQVATTDIGRTAARLLLEGPPAGSRVVQLAGPAELSLEDTAEVITRIAGTPVAAVSIPPSAMAEALVGMGVPREIAALYAEMATAVNDGRLQWEHPEVVRGSVTLEQRLRELLA